MRRKSKGRWHPSRTSGRQKFLRNLDIKEHTKVRTGRQFNKLDLSVNNWSK
jgi:hypothetical protein